MTSGVERRRARRFIVSLPVRKPDINAETAFGVTRDISSAGVYFYTEANDWREGKRIEFAMELPPELTLADPAKSVCSGTIVRAERVEKVIGIAVRIDRFTFSQHA
jgi:PilZ domain